MLLSSILRANKMRSVKQRYWWVRLILLLAFWIASYFVLLTLFATSSGRWQVIDYIYTSIFVVTLLIPVTVNDAVLVPRLLDKRLYIQYLTLIAFTIVLGAWLNQLLFSELIDYILPGFYFISYYEFPDLLKFFAVFVLMGTLITLSLKWFRLQEEKYRANALAKEQVTAEFKALANQVNPHFLFNSLTVVYALAVKNSAETAGAILKLSDILRYVIYQSSAPLVSLRSELVIMKDFIDLQRYRVQPTAQIDLVESLSDEDVQLAPMLMLPLLENSFKHGLYNDSSRGFLRASAVEEDGLLKFSIINNKSTSASLTGGFGLKNLRQRLQLAYPGRHALDVSETESTFAVSMQITLK
jgi:sensor histidine kinase YesM